MITTTPASRGWGNEQPHKLIEIDLGDTSMVEPTQLQQPLHGIALLDLLGVAHECALIDLVVFVLENDE